MPRFFKSPDHFRAWMEKQHGTAAELLVGFYKKDSGNPSITWPESVDIALCFGWRSKEKPRSTECGNASTI